MLTEIAVAALLPLVIMIWIARVTYNVYASLFSALLVLVAVLDGWERPILLKVIASVSLVAGIVVSRRIVKKHNKKWTD